MIMQRTPRPTTPLSAYENTTLRLAPTTSTDLVIPRFGKQRDPLPRIPSTCSAHPTPTCIAPALAATKRALKKIKRNLRRQKKESGDYEVYQCPKSNSSSSSSTYYAPSSSQATSSGRSTPSSLDYVTMSPVETRVTEHFVFSRL